MRDGEQRYRDWVMSTGMIEHANEAEARYAARMGLPPPVPRERPAPPPGCTEDRELKAIARKERARAKAAAKRAQRAAPPPVAPVLVLEAPPPAPPRVGRQRPGRAA